MRPIIHTLLTRWHQTLGLQRQSASWYRDRLREELGERRAAGTIIERLSETSDVFYSMSRAQHDGFPTRAMPPFSPRRHGLAYVYFLSKYTSRWMFYRMAARICGKPTWTSIREVVNPQRDNKITEVGCRHGIDPEQFGIACRKLRKWWPLLP